MAKFTTLLFLITAFFNSHITGQTVYELKYNFNSGKDTVSYSAFYFKNNKGDIRVRLKYRNPATGSINIADTDTKEFFAWGQDGNLDTNTLLLKITKAKDTARGLPLSVSLPVFIFKLDEASGFHEPRGVCKSELNPVMPATASFQAEYLPYETLPGSFVTRYFHPSNQFFQSIYGGRTRGKLRLAGFEKNIKMHVVLASDTKDPNRGPHHKSDYHKMLKTFDTLRKYIGITDENYILKTVIDDDLSSANVMGAVRSLNPAPNDIVVFYFFGHGFRINKKDPYPHINLMSLINITKKAWKADSLKVIANGLSMKKIFDSINVKPGRLKLVLSDVCNVNIGEDPFQTLLPGTRGEGKWDFNAQNVRALFLNPNPVAILGNACKNGEASWSTNRLGGLFTNRFNAMLQEYTSSRKSSVSWKNLMAEVKDYSIKLASETCCKNCGKASTNKIFCKLTPEYMVR